MIRVDLGKDDVSRGKKGLGRLFGGGKKKGGGGLGKGFGKATSGARGIIVFGVAGALAFLPHLFFEQYRAFVTDQQAGRAKEIREKLTALEQETERLLPYKRELESYEAQKKLVRDRIDIVRQLLVGRNGPVSVLDAIGQALPKRAWLTKTDLKLEPKPEITLGGQAYANEDISDFIDALQKSVFISEAVLKNVTKDNVERIDVKTFSILVTPKIKAANVAQAPQPGAAPPAGAAAPPQPAAAGGTDRGVAGTEGL